MIGLFIFISTDSEGFRSTCVIGFGWKGWQTEPYLLSKIKLLEIPFELELPGCNSHLDRLTWVFSSFLSPDIWSSFFYEDGLFVRVPWCSAYVFPLLQVILECSCFYLLLPLCLYSCIQLKTIFCRSYLWSCCLSRLVSSFSCFLTSSKRYFIWIWQIMLFKLKLCDPVCPYLPTSITFSL